MNPQQIPKIAETELLRLGLHRALTMAALAAWDGDLGAMDAHVATVRALVAAPPRDRAVVLAGVE